MHNIFRVSIPTCSESSARRGPQPLPKQQHPRTSLPCRRDLCAFAQALNVRVCVLYLTLLLKCWKALGSLRPGVQ